MKDSPIIFTGRSIKCCKSASNAVWYHINSACKVTVKNMMWNTIKHVDLCLGANKENKKEISDIKAHKVRNDNLCEWNEGLSYRMTKSSDIEIFLCQISCDLVKLQQLHHQAFWLEQCTVPNMAQLMVNKLHTLPTSTSTLYISRTIRY